jgi:hypothetical protein
MCEKIKYRSLLPEGASAFIAEKSELFSLIYSRMLTLAVKKRGSAVDKASARQADPAYVKTTARQDGLCELKSGPDTNPLTPDLSGNALHSYENI